MFKHNTNNFHGMENQINHKEVIDRLHAWKTKKKTLESKRERKTKTKKTVEQNIILTLVD